MIYRGGLQKCPQEWQGLSEVASSCGGCGQQGVSGSFSSPHQTPLANETY
jgi:hypothetical protein